MHEIVCSGFFKLIKSIFSLWIGTYDWTTFCVVQIRRAGLRVFRRWSVPFCCEAHRKSVQMRKSRMQIILMPWGDDSGPVLCFYFSFFLDSVRDFHCGILVSISLRCPVPTYLLFRAQKSKVARLMFWQWMWVADSPPPVQPMATWHPALAVGHNT